MKVYLVAIDYEGCLTEAYLSLKEAVLRATKSNVIDYVIEVETGQPGSDGKEVWVRQKETK